MWTISGEGPGSCSIRDENHKSHGYFYGACLVQFISLKWFESNCKVSRLPQNCSPKDTDCGRDCGYPWGSQKNQDLFTSDIDSLKIKLY